MAAKFELYKDKGSQFRFRLKAGNGEIIASGSESYPDKKSALKGIASIQKNAAEAKIVDTTETEEKKPRAAGTAAKKPKASDPDAKKPAAKKPRASGTAAKKTATRKPAAKKVAENKPAE